MAKTDISMWYTMVFFYSTMTSLRQISLGGLRKVDVFIKYVRGR